MIQTPDGTPIASSAENKAAAAPEQNQRTLPRRIFMPSPTALNWVIAIGLLSLGYAIYLRYLVIEQTSVGLACDNGLKTWLCLTRKIVTGLFDNEVFGSVGLGAALLALIRPSLPLFIIGLAASAFGLVLHNGALSGLAAALLIMCFARPVAETE